MHHVIRCVIYSGRSNSNTIKSINCTIHVIFAQRSSDLIVVILFQLKNLLESCSIYNDQRSHADHDQKKNAISFHTLEIESVSCHIR
ncbi:2-mannosyltransferase,GDP-Man:Man(3)GlcNAc(2)-PP-Dol alpha-1 [Trichinella pseudospiralis]